MAYISEDLVDEIRRLCTQKGWRDEPGRGRGPMTGPWFAAYCALATSEVSEALDAYREKVWSETCPGAPAHIPGCSGRPHEYPKPVGVGPELADALIRILDMADIWNIDLTHELRRVLDYGWTRPYHHGGKQL